MKKINKLSTTLLLGVVGTTLVSGAHAFVDPDDWRMNKWGNWQDWQGPPDMNELRKDQWSDLDQWGPNGWQTPWGSQPWSGNRGGFGNMPWGGNRSNWGSMPWGGNRGGWGNMPWGGNRGNWGSAPWGNPRWQGASPYGYAPQGWNAVPPQPQATPEAQPPQKDRYPTRPESTEPDEKDALLLKNRSKFQRTD